MRWSIDTRTWDAAKKYPFKIKTEVFAAAGGQLIETSAAVVGRKTPLPLDPAIQLKPLEGRVKRAFFDAQQIAGQLLK